MNGLISDVKNPDSKLARQVAELVRQHETEMLFNHSVRVYMFGAIKGLRQKLKFDTELLYIAALFHDLGLVDAYHTDTKRFEVDGANAAREFLRSRGIPDPKSDLGLGSYRPTYHAWHSTMHASRDCADHRRGLSGRRRDRDTTNIRQSNGGRSSRPFRVAISKMNLLNFNYAPS
jgi:hypothetical protein